MQRLRPLLERLTAAVAADDAPEFERVLDDLVHARRKELFSELRRLTSQVRSALETFQLDARFESAGAWSGVAQLIKTAYLELLDIGATNIFEQHDYELHMLLPAYRDRIQPRYLCLTDTTGAGERTRFYAMERAYRQVHGLVGMVLAWKQALRDHDRVKRRRGPSDHHIGEGAERQGRRQHAQNAETTEQQARGA